MLSLAHDFQLGASLFQKGQKALPLFRGEAVLEHQEKLPGFAIYYVKPGDSLWQIGKKYYVSVGRIKEMNNMTEDDIKAGDKLLIVK